MKLRNFFLLSLSSKILTSLLIFTLILPTHIAIGSGQRTSEKDSRPSAQRNSTAKKSSNSNSINSSSSGQRGSSPVVQETPKGTTKLEGYSGSAKSYEEYAGALELAEKQLLARIQESDQIMASLSQQIVEIFNLDPKGIINDIPKEKVSAISPEEFEKYARKIESARLAEMAKEKVSSAGDVNEIIYPNELYGGKFLIRSHSTDESEIKPTYGYDQNNDDPENLDEEDKPKDKKFLGMSKKTWGWIMAIGGVVVAGGAALLTRNCLKKAEEKRNGDQTTIDDLNARLAAEAKENGETFTPRTVDTKNTSNSGSDCWLFGIIGMLAGVALIVMGIKMIKKQKKEDEEKLAKANAAKLENLRIARDHYDDDRDGNGDDIESSTDNDDDDSDDRNEYVDTRTKKSNLKTGSSKVKTKSYAKLDTVKLGKNNFSKPVAASISKYAAEYGVDAGTMANALTAKNTDQELSKIIGDEEEQNFIRSKSSDTFTARVLTNTYKKFGGYEGVERVYNRILASPAWTVKEKAMLVQDDESVRQAIGSSAFRNISSDSIQTHSTGPSAKPEAVSASESKSQNSFKKITPSKLESLFERVSRKIESVLGK